MGTCKERQTNNSDDTIWFKEIGKALDEFLRKETGWFCAAGKNVVDYVVVTVFP